MLISQQKFKSKVNNVFTEKVNKISLIANDDKKNATPDGVRIFPYGYEC